MIEWLCGLLGVEGVEKVHQAQVRFVAPWAENRPALLLFGCVALALLAGAWYLRSAPRLGRAARTALGCLRAALLVALLLILAEPVIALSATQRPRPLLLLLFDGTESMNIRDKLSPEAREQLRKALGARAAEGEVSRAELTRQAVVSRELKLLERLHDKFRLRAYFFNQAGEARELSVSRPHSDAVDAQHLAGQLSFGGPVTAIGAALEDLGRRHRTPLLAGVVVFSDFGQNAGPPPLEAARQLKAPLYAVGIGPREATDLSVELSAPPLLKKGERTEVTVQLDSSGLKGRTARVELLGCRLGSRGGAAEQNTPVPLAPSKTVVLEGGRQTAAVSFEPPESGAYQVRARVRPFEDEALEENNAAEREVAVRDECLRLLFVEHEPTWEWRFVKEVFHRDPLVGREGFRTFLNSADFAVRKSNELYLETLIRPRSEFFATDVVMLSDVPPGLLSGQFQEMLHEYVTKFGGGLVVIAGPRFGVGELKGTKLGELLPVLVDPALKMRDGDFSLQLTPAALQHDFMRLGAGEEEARMAWHNLGQLPWYQPVVRPHPMASVLAVHPVHRCADDQTPQPLIALRRSGKGEVVYVGFNEMWRLRRKYGEKYYRQFWGQLIYRLGLGRALGSQKRFDARTDRKVYQAGDKVRVVVEAYDQNFEPLKVDKLQAKLTAVDAPDAPGGATREITVPLSRDKVIFETSLPVFAEGAHRLRLRDPVLGDESELTFRVAAVTAERRSATRNAELQAALAQQTGGRSYELHEAGRLADDIQGPKVVEQSEHRFPLWNTWVVLLLALGLMMTEWLGRKWVNLR
jgi:hypothetical protein